MAIEASKPLQNGWVELHDRTHRHVGWWVRWYNHDGLIIRQEKMLDEGRARQIYDDEPCMEVST